MYEMPPILRGSAQEQLNALRDYLVRLAAKVEQLEQQMAEAKQKG